MYILLCNRIIEEHCHVNYRAHGSKSNPPQIDEDDEQGIQNDEVNDDTSVVSGQEETKLETGKRNTVFPVLAILMAKKSLRFWGSCVGRCGRMEREVWSYDNCIYQFEFLLLF